MKDLIEKLQHASAEFAEGDGCIGLNLIGEVITRLEAMVGEQKPVAWITKESIRRLHQGGNDSRSLKEQP